MNETEARKYRVTRAGTGADAAEWLTVASGFGSLLGAACWLFDTHNTDNPDVPLRVERYADGFWRDVFVVLPAGVENAQAGGKRELGRLLCVLLGEFRRACYCDGMSDEEREHFAHVLNMVESGLCSSLRAAESPDDAETLQTLGRYRRALLGAGLSLEERGELAMPGGILDQIEAHVLAVFA